MNTLMGKNVSISFERSFQICDDMNLEADEVKKWPATGSRMLNDLAWRAIRHSLGLSQRLMEILKRVFDEKKESTIADELGISPHTGHIDVERIYHKLQIHSRQELAQFIITGFLPLPADVRSKVPPICGSSTPLHDGFEDNLGDTPLGDQALNGCESPKYQSLGSFQGVCRYSSELRGSRSANQP